MIIELFALFFIVSLILIGLGYFTDVDVLKVIGFLFIFILGLTVGGYTGDSITYHTGDNITDTGAVTVVTSTYDSYTSHTFGFYTCLIGLLGFVIVYVDRKNHKIEEGD